MWSGRQRQWLALVNVVLLLLIGAAVILFFVAGFSKKMSDTHTILARDIKVTGASKVCPSREQSRVSWLRQRDRGAAKPQRRSTTLNRAKRFHRAAFQAFLIIGSSGGISGPRAPDKEPQNAPRTKKQPVYCGKEPSFRLQFPKEVKNRIGTVKFNGVLIYMPIVGSTLAGAGCAGLAYLNYRLVVWRTRAPR